MRINRGLVAATAPFALSALLFAGAAQAGECEVEIGGSAQRGKTLEGDIKSVKKGKRAKITITQYGEHIPFEPHEGVVVSGLKSDYGDLKRGDHVVVCGKLLAKPRVALGIEVKPAEEDAAEDL